MEYNIAVIPGDGIGPEIIREAMKVLDAVGRKYAIVLAIPRFLWVEYQLMPLEYLLPMKHL